MVGEGGASQLLQGSRPGNSSIAVYNPDTNQVHKIGSRRMQSILDDIGKKIEPSVKRIFLAGPENKVQPPENGGKTMVIAEDHSDFVWREIQKKGPDSPYPPMVPREFGNYFASLANADTEGAYWQVLNELNREVERCRQIDDRHSVRYLENAIGAVQGAADLARPKKIALDDDLKTMARVMELKLESSDKTATDRINQVQDAANRRLETLNNRLDLSNFGTLLRYGATSLVATGYTVYKTLTDWLASWPIGAKGGLVAGAAGMLIGAAFGFRNYVRKLVKKATEKETKDCDKLRTESAMNQNALIEVHSEHMLQMARDWNKVVQGQTLEVTLKCFDIAMDFFPEYVKEEMKKFGADWTGKDFAGQNREEARRIIAEGLHKQMPARVIEQALGQNQEKTNA